MSLAKPLESVEKLQTSLQTKAKAQPAFRFYTLWDKVYRKDVLLEAYQRCRANACQWRRDFPQECHRKIPQSGGLWRSAVSVIGASVLRRATATLQGRRNGVGGGVRLEADVFRQEVGVLAQPIA